MHIAPYEQGNIFNKDPLRPRRLLMHKREIMRLYGKVKQDGYALIPLSVYSAAVSSRSRLRSQEARNSTTSETTPQRKTPSARSTAQ